MPGNWSLNRGTEYVKFPHMEAESYLDRYRLSVGDRLSYWSARAEEFIDWQKPFTQVETKRDGKTHWFEDGLLNVASNCLDRHLETKGDDIAIIWCAEETGVDRRISYKQLHYEVSTLANCLAAKGLEKGDRVCLYSTLLPEVIVGMLACARLGLPYQFVNLELDEQAIKEQISGFQPKLVITQDKGVRSGKDYPLYQSALSCIEGVDSVEQLIVVRYFGGETLVNEQRDSWYHQVIAMEADPVEPAAVGASDPLFISYHHEQKAHLGFTSAGYLLYCAITQRRVFDYQDGDIFWAATNFNIVNGHALAIWGSLINGATTVLYDGDANLLNYSRFWEIVSSYEVNLLYVREDGLENMIAYDSEAVERQSWQNLRVVGLAASENNQKVLKKCEELRFDYCQIVTTVNVLNTGQILFANAVGRGAAEGMGDPFFGVEPIIVDEEGKSIDVMEAEGELKLLNSWPAQNMLLTVNEFEKNPESESSDKQDYQDIIVGQWHKNDEYIHTGLSAKRDAEGNYFLSEK